jgi:hypothetical protein
MEKCHEIRFFEFSRRKLLKWDGEGRNNKILNNFLTERSNIP